MCVFLSENTLRSEWVKAEVEAFAGIGQIPMDADSPRVLYLVGLPGYCVEKRRLVTGDWRFLEWVEGRIPVKIVHCTTVEEGGHALARSLRNEPLLESAFADAIEYENDEQRLPFCAAFWQMSNVMSRWRDVPIDQLLRGFEGLHYPYDNWQDKCRNPPDRQIVSILTGAIGGEKRRSVSIPAVSDSIFRIFGDGWRDTTLVTVRSDGTSMNALYSLALEYNPIEEFQTAYYHIRAPKLTRLQTDILDVLTTVAIGFAVERWRCAWVEWEDIVNVLVHQEKY